MMFGTRERFTYFQCSACGCLQLTDIPLDLTPYYPNDYYSFARPSAVQPRSKARQWLNDCRNAGTIFGHSLFSRALSALRPGPKFQAISKMLRGTGIRTLRAKVLDVGCGSGDLLSEMAEAGFSQVVGVDPFAKPRIDAGGRLRVMDITIDDLTESDFDFVMSHHSLEHVTDQLQMLRGMRKVMRAEGLCLVRIPVAGSDPWRRYRENWVELDPPRHLIVHTQRSFELVANAAGLRVDRVEFDETAFGYWGSELYKSDISLTDPQTRSLRSPLAHFASAQLSEFARLAEVANSTQAGGRACFYLRKA
jgi:SAM-dependent methyltransferase